jgi:hypothetical protein
MAFLSACFGAGSAYADSNIEQVPTTWRMQDYVGGGIQIYMTSATCTTLYGTGTTDEVNRLWSLILTASVTGKVVGVYYNPTTCNISSFYKKEGW